MKRLGEFAAPKACVQHGRSEPNDHWSDQCWAGSVARPTCSGADSSPLRARWRKRAHA